MGIRQYLRIVVKIIFFKVWMRRHRLYAVQVRDVEICLHDGRLVMYRNHAVLIVSIA